jgi:hypothetical protein
MSTYTNKHVQEKTLMILVAKLLKIDKVDYNLVTEIDPK